jgi:hypothetical protein
MPAGNRVFPLIVDSIAVRFDGGVPVKVLAQAMGSIVICIESGPLKLEFAVSDLPVLEKRNV